MIWFVDAFAPSGGDGRLSSPFKDLAITPDSFDLNAVDEPGDVIFVAEGPYNAGLTLLAGQRLIGDGSPGDLAGLSGIILAANSVPLPAFSGQDPLISTISAPGDVITLSSDNLISGVTLNANLGTAIIGSSVGLLTVLETTVLGGGGLNIDGGTLDVSLDVLFTIGALNPGIKLINVDGEFSIVDPTGEINVQDETAVTMIGTVALLSVNATFASVSSAGGSAPGIHLANISGLFRVTGDGTDMSLGGNGSGGTIATKTGEDGTDDGIGVLLNNVDGVFLSRMLLHDFDNFAIHGTSVSNFELTHSTITGTSGNNAGLDEDAIRLVDCFDTVAFTLCDISGGFESNVIVINSSSMLLDLTMTANSFGSNGQNGVQIRGMASSSMAVSIQDNVFTSAPGNLLHISVFDDSLMDLVVSDNAFSNNHPNVASGGGGVVIVGGGGESNPNLDYAITFNTFRDALGIALNVHKGAGTGSFNGTILGNQIGVSGLLDSGSAQASGIKVGTHGLGNHSTVIDDNVILQYNEAGLHLTSVDGGNTLDALIVNNTIGEPGDMAMAGILVDEGALSSDTHLICADIGGIGGANAFVGAGGTLGFDLIGASSISSTINLPGLAGGAAAVPLYIQGRNTGTPTVSASGNYTGSGVSCPDPLTAARGEGSGGADVGALTIAELDEVVAEAIRRWTLAGLSDDQLARQHQIVFEIVNLPDGKLGEMRGSVMAIDHNGAGYGWFVDQTPEREEEFLPTSYQSMQLARPGKNAADRMDLLTVVMHELGHTMGMDHSSDKRALMGGTLDTGIRHLPLAAVRQPDSEPMMEGVDGSAFPLNEIQLLEHIAGADDGSLAGDLPGDLTLDIGFLDPGDELTISFDVTIDTPSPPSTSQVCNQALISGDNFASVLSDDPDVAGTTNATCTLLDPGVGACCASFTCSGGFVCEGEFLGTCGGSFNCICVSTVEGDLECISIFTPCGTACSSSAQCGAGFACIVDTCCDETPGICAAVNCAGSGGVAFSRNSEVFGELPSSRLGQIAGLGGGEDECVEFGLATCGVFNGRHQGEDTTCAAVVCACPPSSAPELEVLTGSGEDVTKLRALGITAGDAGEIQAIRVTLTNLPAPFNIANGGLMWVGEPFVVCENSGQDEQVDPSDCLPTPTGTPLLTTYAPLQCDPLFRNWSGDGVINLVHPFVIPNATYTVQVVRNECPLLDEAGFSEPLVINTPIWGDIGGICFPPPCLPPDGSVDVVTDVTSALDKFKNIATGVTKARGDVEPSVVDYQVNISDVAFILDAFSGDGHPFEPDGLPCADFASGSK